MIEIVDKDAGLLTGYRMPVRNPGSDAGKDASLTAHILWASYGDIKRQPIR
jgi:hypothetical protein